MFEQIRNVALLMKFNVLWIVYVMMNLCNLNQLCVIML